ncbi:sigma-54 dependent transcriptional regulator [Massilia sp. S19_KUP03_FR1]|uniref:sigma-54 dependent transcriptional regulator n=1 Tax=Massilia sp. S19_KUP03_FR1 TaxID=3025503 RepID=UPI002FCD9BF9
MNLFSCIVTANHAHLPQAKMACQVLGAIGAARVELQADPLPLESGCDVLIPVVDPQHCARIAADIARMHCDHPGCNVIPLACDLSQEQLSSLLNAGACDFVTMPFDSQSLIIRVRRALGLMAPAGGAAAPEAAVPAHKELLGASPAFMQVLALLPKIAAYDAGLLIMGETGTGKEVYARAVHGQSARAARPWVAVNCGAIPVELLESELFGHVRGAYTQAHAARAGLVREAEGGTLFLDEIDALPLSAQSKLLRFLQEREYRALGSDKVVRADVRVIAASNQDLPALAERGAFRSDLLFRLSVLTVTLPPLRERRADIQTLALHFIDHFGARAGRDVRGLAAQALRQLLAHAWPGNVRELRHVIERAVLMGKTSMVQPDDLQLATSAAPARAAEESFCSAKSRVVVAFEIDYIQHLLGVCEGNISRAAQAAGKDRRAFFELIRKHRIDPDQFRSRA